MQPGCAHQGIFRPDLGWQKDSWSQCLQEETQWSRLSLLPLAPPGAVSSPGRMFTGGERQILVGNSGIILSSFWLALKGSTEPTAKGCRHWNASPNTPVHLLIAILDLPPFAAGSQQRARSQLGCGFVYFPANGAAGAVPEQENGNIREVLSSSHRSFVTGTW